MLRFYLFIVVAVEFDSVGFVTFAADGSVEWHIQRLLWLRQTPGFPHGLPNRKGNFDRDCNPWWRKPKAIGKHKIPLWVIVFFCRCEWTRNQKESCFSFGYYRSTNPISVDFRIVGKALNAQDQIATESEVMGSQGHWRKRTSFTRNNKQ